MSVVSILNNIGRLFSDFFNSLSSIVSFLVSLIKTILFGITSLFSAVWQLFQWVFDGGFIDSLFSTIDIISNYIGGPATVFLCTLFFVILVRIGISFVFKLLRLNIDYHSLQSKSKRRSVEDMKKPRH